MTYHGIALFRDYACQCSRQVACGCLVRLAQGLPKHTRLRITANFHFIDMWNSETGYLMADIGGPGATLEYVWTERYDVADYKNSSDACGGPLGEGRFSVPIDVSLVSVNA